MTTNYELYQTFTNVYPPQAAVWCNENGSCHIEEIEASQGERIFQIVENKTETIETSNLELSAVDFERAVYKAFGKDFDDMLSMAENLNKTGDADIDVKALKIELKTNNLCRGNDCVSQIGEILGLSENQLDNFFTTGDYTTLIPS